MLKNLNLIYLDYRDITHSSSGFSLGAQHDFDHVENLKKFAKNNNYTVYDLTYMENTKTEKEIIEEIIDNKSDTIVYITNNKSLFTNFYRPIQLISSNSYEDNEFKIIEDMDSVIYNLQLKNVDNIGRHIRKIFFRYGAKFTINIELLIKETSYNKTDSMKKLHDIIEEDLDLLKFKKILTSRLSIILYRLFFFDLDAKATSIGYYYKEKLGVQSKSYKFNNLNNNTAGFYFKNLVNKPFRGYEIPIVKLQPMRYHDMLYKEKIKIAKKLLHNKVKIKVVSNALEMTEEDLRDIIYSQNNTFSTLYN
ncbi:hypothetical protein [Sulfurimonas sp.]|uniref:hypothetical protein n=1 Tax=Sulfurimonas sp. TaxID=2022749 RepID=UPI003569AA44